MVLLIAGCGNASTSVVDGGADAEEGADALQLAWEAGPAYDLHHPHDMATVDAVQSAPDMTPMGDMAPAGDMTQPPMCLALGAAGCDLTKPVGANGCCKFSTSASYCQKQYGVGICCSLYDQFCTKNSDCCIDLNTMKSAQCVNYKCALPG